MKLRKNVENNFIYSDRGEGKTELLIKLANDLSRYGGYKIDFISLTSGDQILNLDREICYDIYPSNIVNKKYILDLKEEKIKAKKLDILFIDDINYLDNWDNILSLQCDKFISVDILESRINTGFEKELNNIEYNLFHLSKIQYNNFLNPYLRDKKINQLLS